MTNKKKKGFSLVEVAIALAIVVIVSVTALTIVLNSIAPKINNNNRSHAQNFAYNVVQCFQEATSCRDTISLLMLSYNITEENMSESIEPDENGYTTYTYYSEEHKYTAQIKLLFSTPENSVERPKMKLVISTSEKGEEIIAFEYERGVSPNAE